MIMKKTLSIVLFLYVNLTALSQCDINNNQGPMIEDPEGSYNMQLIEDEISLEPLSAGYDTLTAFPNATVNQLYEAVVGLRIPNDTSFIYDIGNGPQLFENVQIKYMFKLNTF